MASSIRGLYSKKTDTALNLRDGCRCLMQQDRLFGASGEGRLFSEKDRLLLMECSRAAGEAAGIVLYGRPGQYDGYLKLARSAFRKVAKSAKRSGEAKVAMQACLRRAT